MMPFRVVVVWGLLLPLVPVASGAPSVQGRGAALRLQLGQEAAVRKVSVAFGYTTTVYFPVPCISVVAGDQRNFGAVIDAESPNRVIIAPRTAKLGVSSNVTIECQGDVRVALSVQVTKPEKATQVIEYFFSKESDARVAAAIDRTRREMEQNLQKRLALAEERGRREALRNLSRSLVTRFETNDDTEYSKRHWIYVKVFRQVTIGTEHYVVFAVQNRSEKAFFIRTVEMQRSASGRSLEPVCLQSTGDEQTVNDDQCVSSYFEERRVPPGAQRTGVTVFRAASVDSGTFSLRVAEDDKRWVRVDGIEF